MLVIIFSDLVAPDNGLVSAKETRKRLETLDVKDVTGRRGAAAVPAGIILSH